MPTFLPNTLSNTKYIYLVYALVNILPLHTHPFLALLCLLAVLKENMQETRTCPAS